MIIIICLNGWFWDQLNVNLLHPDEQIVPPKEQSVNYEDYSDLKIKELVESKRLELKEIQKTIIVTRAVLHHLYQRKKNLKNKWEQNFTQNELVALDVISGIPKKLVSEDKIRENLRHMKFPEDRIFERKRMGVYRYTIPETEEEKLEIIRRNEKIEAESKYHRVLHPVIKQFNKDVYFSFNLDNELKPISTVLRFYHSNYSQENIPDSVKK